MRSNDPFDLERFVQAQQPMIADALAELRSGRKRGHWMWFIFPQLRGLGYSATAHAFGISGLEEAAAYLRHSVLGSRLNECTRLVNAVQGRSAKQIFGEIDALKFRSSMTLFAKAAPENSIFPEALNKFYKGEFDPLTMGLLAKPN